ncbi:hypothetical protein ACTXOW_07005 [Corynebacterium variabile]|uniref:hypothetical protein n=1 Tax=Corynebacterium variabile TaxID=1727 RepID=UPI003FD4794A
MSGAFDDLFAGMRDTSEKKETKKEEKRKSEKKRETVEDYLAVIRAAEESSVTMPSTGGDGVPVSLRGLTPLAKLPDEDRAAVQKIWKRWQSTEVNYYAATMRPIQAVIDKSTGEWRILLETETTLPEMGDAGFPWVHGRAIPDEWSVCPYPGAQRILPVIIPMTSRHHVLIGSPLRQWEDREIHWSRADRSQWVDDNFSLIYTHLVRAGLKGDLLYATLCGILPTSTLGDEIPASTALVAEHRDRFDARHAQWKKDSDQAKKTNSGWFTAPEPVYDGPEVTRYAPTLTAAGTRDSEVWLEITPARGSTLTPEQLGKSCLAAVQKAVSTRDVTADVAPNGSAARFTISLPEVVRDDLAGSWIPSMGLLPRGGGVSEAAAVRAGWDLRIPLGQSMSGETLWWDFKADQHLAVLGTTASGKSWSILSWITELGGNFGGSELVVIDGKNSGDFNSLMSTELAAHSGVRCVADRPVSAFATLLWVNGEVERRKKINAKLKAQGETKLPFPRLIVIVDEIGYLMTEWPKKIREQADKIISQILRAARSVGVHIALISQDARDSSYPNGWLTNLSLKVSLGANPGPMIQKKILGDEKALTKYPAQAAFVADKKMKGRGLMNREIDGEQVVDAFRSSHVWSPTKGTPESVPGWAEMKTVWEEKYWSAPRFGFEIPDDLDDEDPQAYSQIAARMLDDEDGHPLEDRAHLDPSNVNEYQPWDGSVGISLGGDF